MLLGDRHLFHHEYMTKMMDSIAKKWHVGGVIQHYNRGGEGLSIGIAENRLGLLKRGNKVMTYEGKWATSASSRSRPPGIAWMSFWKAWA